MVDVKARMKLGRLSQQLEVASKQQVSLKKLRTKCLLTCLPPKLKMWLNTARLAGDRKSTFSLPPPLTSTNLDRRGLLALGSHVNEMQSKQILISYLQHRILKSHKSNLGLFLGLRRRSLFVVIFHDGTACIVAVILFDRHLDILGFRVVFFSYNIP